MQKLSIFFIFNELLWFYEDCISRLHKLYTKSCWYLKLVFFFPTICQGWASLVIWLVKNWTAMQETQFDSSVRKSPWKSDRLLTQVFMYSVYSVQYIYAEYMYPVFNIPSSGSDSKESAGNVGKLGLIPGLGRSPRGEHGNPLQYSFLENPHGRTLVGYSLWGHRESDMTKHSIAFTFTKQHSK